MNPQNRVITDKQGNFWIATHKEGIILFNKMYKNFRAFNAQFKNQVIQSVFEDSQGNFWVGSETLGLYFINSKNKTTQHYSIDNLNQFGFSASCVFKIYETYDNELFFGTYQGLFQYNRKSNKFKRYPIKPNDSTCLNHYDIRDLAEDVKGNLWIATNAGGINILNRKTQTFTYLLKNETQPNSGIPYNYCLKILKDKNENMWIGTYSGLTKYDIKKKKFFPIGLNKQNGLSHNWIYSLQEDLNGNIWIGTANGLNVYSPKSGICIQYFQKDGLSDNVICNIQNDEKGNLWISTATGLNKFDMAQGKIISYSKTDDLPVVEYSHGSSFKTQGGEILFVGNGGITSFYPNEIKNNPYTPKVLISDMKLFNTSVPIGVSSKGYSLKHHISYTKEITLSYSQNVITFYYLAFNYLNPEKNQFAYQMVGFDKDWQYVGTKKDVTFTNLNPGDYVFQVKASNDDGIWSKNPTKIIIHIIPPFWKTRWFYILVLTIASLIVFGYNRYRIYRILKINKVLEEAVYERTEEIRLQNQTLEIQANDLNETNTLLEERQQHIEEQAEELMSQRDELEELNNMLNETNAILIERKKHIEEQAEELREQRDELSKLNSTKDKLFSILAHDLKSPFNTIIGFSELLLKNIKQYSKEKIITQVTFIRDSSRSTFELLENLLNWSRSQRGIIEFEPVEKVISETITYDLRIFRQQALRKEINIDFLQKGIEKPVMVDPNMFSAILRNLTSNAIKYSQQGSKIIITLAFEKKQFRISITDTGIGMSEETRNNILNHTNYSSKPGTAGEKGTGLGILLCIDFINRHGGKLFVESIENEGTTFSFTIPYKLERDIPT